MTEFAWDEHSYEVAKMVDEFAASAGGEAAVSQELTGAEWLRKFADSIWMVDGFTNDDGDRLRSIADGVEQLLEALKGLLGGIERTPCRCHEAYTGRGLTDPNCSRCDLDVTSDELDAARAAIAKAAKHSVTPAAT